MSNLEPTTQFWPNDNSNDVHSQGEFQFTTLLNSDRVDLVQLTDPNNAALGAAYFDISTLELSALGANADIDGHWNWVSTDKAKDVNITAWRDLGQAGRNISGLIAKRGYLFPLGHRAVLTTYFDRVYALDPTQALDPGMSADNKSVGTDFPVAYLQMHTVLRVSERVKNYGSGTVGEPWTSGGSAGSSDWPFSKVRMMTLKTPDLDEPPPNSGQAASYQHFLDPPYDLQAFWPTYNSGTDVTWTFVLTDLAGRDVTLTMPLVFVYGHDSQSSYATGYEFAVGSSANPGFCEYLVNAYHNQNQHQRYADAGGARVLFAPEAGGPVGGTTHPTLSIMLGAATSSYDPSQTAASPSSPGQDALAAAGQPNFYPVLRRARIRLHAAEVLIGGDLDDSNDDSLIPGPGVEVEWYPSYVAPSPGESAGSNSGAVYLGIVDNQLTANLPANTTGGIGTPSTTLTGLSATAGTVGGDLDYFAANAPAADLMSYFPPTLDPMLLGGLKLSDILDQSNFQMPTIISQSVQPAAAQLTAAFKGAVVLLDGVTTGTDPSTGAQTVTYSLQTSLGSSPDGTFVPDSSDGMLNMTATVESSLDGSPPTSTANGSVDPFTINLASVLALHFESVTFAAGSGQSTSVNVNLDKATFEGCLEFVNALEELLGTLGGGGLAIHVTPTQAIIGTSLSIPAIQLGMFNMSGISFAVGAVIPFLSGNAVATFAFASPDNPFTLTCCCFGGGGYVSVGVGFGGLQTLQSSFEVEGEAAIGIVVASGSVSFSVGIYYSYDDTGADLSGFVTLTGQVELLGIITVSITMHVSLTWELTAGAVQGTATLQIGISICGFGVTVGVTVTKSFGGSSTNTRVASGGGQGALRRPDVGKPPPGPPGINNLGSGSAPLPPVTTPPAPSYLRTAVDFDDLISEADWSQYCMAFGFSATLNLQAASIDYLSSKERR